MFDSFGLDISDHSMKYAYVKRRMFGVYLEHYGEWKVPEGLIVNGEISDQAKASAFLRDSIKSVKGLPSFVTVSLPDSKTFIKLLSISVPESGDVASAVTAELANHVPIPLDQFVVDWTAVDHPATRTAKRAKQTDRVRELRVLTVACESRTVQEYVSVLRSANLSPVAFEVEAQATARAILCAEDVNRDLSKATVVIDWGETQASIMFFAAGTLVLSASSNISGREVTRNIAEKLSIDFERAEQAKLICGLNPKKCKGIVKQYLEEYIRLLAQEVEKGLEFYTTHIASTGAIRALFLVGGGSNLKDLEVELERLLDMGVRPEFGNVFRNIPEIRNADSLPKTKRVSYATAIGLALRTIV